MEETILNRKFSENEVKDSYSKVEYSERFGFMPKGNDLILICGQKDNPSLIQFRCPCGCGNINRLSLKESDNPHWKIAITGDKVTLTPSVHGPIGKKECNSHYFLIDNKIKWC